MRIYPPYGTEDGTPWINGNPATGERGSVIDGRAIDHSQQEIVNAIIRLGLTPDAADLEQLGKAIQNAIAASTGSAPTGDYLTLATARARLPIYPEVLTSTGRLTVTSPSSGQILVGSAGAIRHRGIFDVAMADLSEGARTFVVLPSKTSHLRWSPSGGLQRCYLDDGAYNPSGLPETDASFDSTYDSALLARIVTDASANATITTLINRDRLMHASLTTKIVTRTSSTSGGGLFVTPFDPVVLNWSRTPQNTASVSRTAYGSALAVPPEEPEVRRQGSYSDGTGSATASVSRYAANYVSTVDLNAAAVSLTLGFQLSAVFIA